LPGILNLAIEGRKRLYERGCFLQPASAADLLADAEDLASPITQCVKECFTLRDDAVISKSDAFDIWRAWAGKHGHHVGNSATFGKDLNAAFPHIRTVRPRVNGKQVPAYAGIGRRIEPTSEEMSRATLA
jgi:putative DNA primase/helicase